MPRGGHNRKTARELADAATSRSDRLLADVSSREHLRALLHEWVSVAQLAVQEISSETSVTVVNAGDQLQRHPAVTVLETASKRIEALVVLAERFEDDESGGADDSMPPEPPKFTPRVVADEA
jgi:hypothetical protein